MLNINYISETFFNCCNIPIKTISKDYKEIDKYGYNDYMDNLYPKDKMKNFKTFIDFFESIVAYHKYHYPKN